MSILIDQNGIAFVTPPFRYLLPKVWRAIKQNYFYHSYKKIHSSATKLQRFWRKASGFHNGFKLIEPFQYKLSNIAPILFRQSHECYPEVLYREIPYYREQGFTSGTQVSSWVANDGDFMICHLQITMVKELKIINGWVCKNTPKRFNKRPFEPEWTEDHIYKLVRNNTTGVHSLHRKQYKKFCCCSDPKAVNYIRQVSRNNKYILKIFEILAGDSINIKTRIKLSKFIQQRLS